MFSTISIPTSKVVSSSAYYFMLNYDTRRIAPTAELPDVTKGLTSEESRLMFVAYIYTVLFSIFGGPNYCSFGNNPTFTYD